MALEFEILQVMEKIARLERLGYDPINLRLQLRELLLAAGMSPDIVAAEVGPLGGIPLPQSEPMPYVGDSWGQEHGVPVVYSGGLVGREIWSRFLQPHWDAYTNKQYDTADQRDKSDVDAHGVLADYFEEVGDPRADILRRWQLHRQEGSPTPDDDRAFSKSGWRGIGSPSFGRRRRAVFTLDDRSQIHVATDPKITGNKIALYWLNNPPPPVTQWELPSGYMDLHEVRDFANRLPEHHATALHDFLDENFGRPEPTSPSALPDQGNEEQYYSDRTPTMYATEQDWWRELANSPRDRNTLAVFADWAQETGHPLADLLAHLRDHGTPSQEWNWSQINGDDFWDRTYHKYPHEKIPGYVREFPMHNFKNGCLTISPLRDTDDQHYAEMAFEHPETGQWRAWIAAIPAQLGHETANRLAEADPSAATFRDHLQKAQIDRDRTMKKEQPDSTRYADSPPPGRRPAGNLVMQPGRRTGAKTPAGNELVTHDVQDEHGNVLGDVQVHPSGDTLHVHWAGAAGMAAGEGRGANNPMGARHVRPMISQLAAHYPTARVLKYTPAAGRLAAGTPRYVDLDEHRPEHLRVGDRPPAVPDVQPAQSSGPPPEWQRAYDDAHGLFADHEFARKEANRATGHNYARQDATGAPLRYGTSNVTEADFHRAIDEDVSDKLNHGAYADWLDEQGKGAHAELVRRASESPSDRSRNLLGGAWRNFGTWMPEENSEAWYSPENKDTGRPGSMILRMRMSHYPNGALEFFVNPVNHDEAIALLRGVHAEGGARNKWYLPPEDDQSPVPEKQYAAQDSNGRALRYARVDYALGDARQFEGAIRSAAQEAQDATNGEMPDFRHVYREHPVHGVFADYLAEHGDPRERLARSPLWGSDVQHHFQHELGLQDASDAPNMPGARRFVSPFGHNREHRFPDGSRSWVTPWGDGQVTHVHATWQPGNVGNFYHLPMTIQEFDDWVDQFPDDERERLLRTFPRPQTQEQYARAVSYARKFNRAPKGGASVPVPKKYRGGQFVPAYYAPQEEVSVTPRTNQWGGPVNTLSVEPLHASVSRHGLDPETPPEIVEDKIRDVDGDHRADIFRTLHKARRVYMDAMKRTPRGIHEMPWFSHASGDIGVGLASGDIETPAQLAGHITSSLGTEFPRTAAAWRDVARVFHELRYLRDNHEEWLTDADYNSPNGEARYSVAENQHAPHGTESRWRPSPAVQYAAGDLDPNAPEPQSAGWNSPVAEFHKQLTSPEHNATRWGHPEGDHTLRQVAADAYEESGDSTSAYHLRNGGHVMFEQGRWVPARFDTSELMQHVVPIHRHANNHGYDFPPPDIWDVGERRVDDANLPYPENHPGSEHYPPGHVLVGVNGEDGPYVGMHATEVPGYVADHLDDLLLDQHIGDDLGPGGHLNWERRYNQLADRLRNAKVEVPDSR